jgi:hypothetical protein
MRLDGLLQGAVPDVLVGALLGGLEGHRQYRLSLVQRLRLRLRNLADRQHHGTTGRSPGTGQRVRVNRCESPESAGGDILVKAITRARVRGGT